MKRIFSFTLLGILLLAACDAGDYDEEEFVDDTSDEYYDEDEGEDETFTGEETSDDEEGSVQIAGDELLLRDFVISLPLFAPDSAWNQTTIDAAVLPESEQQILVLYRVLLGDNSSLHPNVDDVIPPFMYVDYDEWTVPIFLAGNGNAQVLVCNYDGDLDYTNPKLPEASSDPGGPVPVLAPAGVVRPSGPEGTYSDGHLVLYQPESHIEYDFWQATTARQGECESEGGGQLGTVIYEAGAVDFFDVQGPGANPIGYYSARASGLPLLGGLLLPEDIESGAIKHALAFSIPRPRNTSPRGEPDPNDLVYPSSQVEGEFYNTNPLALAQGQRIRLKGSIVIADEPWGDAFGAQVPTSIDDLPLAPITRMLLTALHTHGAIIVDNADGFGFYAEDSHTANLRLSDEEVNILIGQPPDAPLPEGLTKWQIVMEKLNEELPLIPLASGGSAEWWEYDSFGRNPGNATIGFANFEVVEPATQP